ncbi:MAG: hypothetical protein AAF442_08290 [Pseudomonadota bacterium]
MASFLRLVALCVLIAGITSAAHAQFAAIKATARVRLGPGLHYPTVYRMVPAWYPVEITDAFDHWRRIRHLDNAGESPAWVEGWTHISNLSSKRSLVLVLGDRTLAIYRRPDLDSWQVGWIEPRAVARFIRCDTGNAEGSEQPALWCLLRSGDVMGWVPRRHLWGIPSDPP